MKISKMQQRVLAKTGKAPMLSQITVELGHYGEYGYEGPNKPDKGQRGGSCNRTRCQRPGAVWWNRGSYSWYCTACARMLNHANRGDPFCESEPLCSIDAEAEAAFEAVA